MRKLIKLNCTSEFRKALKITHIRHTLRGQKFSGLDQSSEIYGQISGTDSCILKHFNKNELTDKVCKAVITQFLLNKLLTDKVTPGTLKIPVTGIYYQLSPLNPSNSCTKKKVKYGQAYSLPSR